ncbi:MAG: hypothetical protein GQE15_33270 [Archangiaceae bacterium]|nr:hypothetical protein [Archangiaceae bacterium]
MSKLLLVVTLCLGAAAFACKCPTDSTFLDNAMGGSVVVVNVVEVGEQSMKVTVERQLAGPKLSGAVVVEGGDGGNCNASLRTFTKGQRLVLILSGPKHDLNGCGAHSLTLEKDVAKGVVAEGVKSMPLSQLEARVAEAQKKYEQFIKGGG